ncbi:microtubule-associated protein 65-5 [Actinidia rufa]|uniref:Microtubule-associated protein 65-5 n=1 Tax=Actinidia rufa TaxID=165716 RepID=A0A7J0DE51_9ERIC|nr:microtubule-associated protein 65-5 [Actinidia rufa]
MSTTAAAPTKPSSLSGTTTTCGSLLQELQEIWDEIGESDCERDNMLLQLEQECLDIYRRKVEKTRKHKADLHQSLTEAEAEINNLISSLGERASVPQYENVKGTLKERISSIKPVLEDLRLKKEKRIKDFLETQLQIGRICAEIAGNSQFINSAEPQINEWDLTLKKLGELKSQLQELQYEKTLRLQRVDNHISTIHALSVVMSLDFNKKITEAHPSLGYLANGQSKSISNETLARLTGLVHSLKQEKQKRLRKLQDLGSTLMELWSLMDTSVEEQKRFDHVTCLISSSVDEVLKQGCLALDVIEQTEVEVERVNVLKGSKMKELVFKRQNELEEIYRGVHMDVDSDTARQILIGLMESGNVNLSDLLSSMDDQILKAKQQALSRKDILDKVEKWKHASEEENWLDEYEREIKSRTLHYHVPDREPPTFGIVRSKSQFVRGGANCGNPELDTPSGRTVAYCSSSSSKGSLPDIFEKLSSLNSLALSYNRLSGAILASFYGSNLQILWLNDQDSDGITGNIGVIGLMVSLAEVWLHGNNIMGSIPNNIGYVTSLKELNLNGNLLVGMIPPNLAAMALQLLDLNNNMLMGPIPKLWLHGNGFTDENRYNAGRGAHKNLKRAEKARILVSKIPSLVENLTAKVKAWEIEKGIPFLYDKASLLHMLDEFNVLRQEKEEEKRRSREQKRLQEQFTAEQEVLYGSRPTIKKPLVQSATSNTLTRTPTSRRLGTPVAHHGISAGKERRDSGKVSAVIPVNYVALAKDDSVSRGH